MREVLRQLYYAIARVPKFIYWQVLNLGYALKFISVYDIPVIVNNFNRLTYPLQLFAFLEKCGFTRIVILDNDSTYPPLLNFYKDCKHEVVPAGRNYGHRAFWESGLYEKYKWNYFIYTDSDVVPIESCPRDFIRYFKILLDKNHRLDKIGFGIKIDDLPDTFRLKDKVIAYEKRYWEKEVQSNIYDAPIDTTMALYRPLSDIGKGESYSLPAYRVGAPYLVRHLPWYVDSKNLSEEEIYYLQTCNDSSSIGKQLLGDKNVY